MRALGIGLDLLPKLPDVDAQILRVSARTEQPLGNHSIRDCVQYQNNDKHCAHRQPENLWCVAAREFVVLEHLGLDLWVHG